MVRLHEADRIRDVLALAQRTVEHDEFVAQQALRRVQGDFAATTWEAFQRYVLCDEPATAVAQALGLPASAVTTSTAASTVDLKVILGGDYVEAAITSTP